MVHHVQEMRMISGCMIRERLVDDVYGSGMGMEMELGEL